MPNTRQLQNERQQKGGLLRSWLRTALWFGADATGADDCADVERSVALSEDATPVSPGISGNDGASGNGPVVLPFPIYGEALLVRLAELLRRHVGDREPVDCPFSFAVSRCPGSWLAIDDRSSVEFVTSRSEFRFEVDVAPNTSIVIRTGDFDSLVE